MMVDERAIDIGERKAAQTFHRVVGRERSITHIFDQLTQCRLVHRIIVPDRPTNALP